MQEVLGVLAEQGLVHRTGGSDDLDSPDAEGQWTLDERIVSGGRRQPAFGVVGQLRDRRHDARSARDRRNRFHQRAGDAASEGHLHRRGPLYQVERLDFEGRKAFVREIDCDYYTDAITYTRVTHHRYVRANVDRVRPRAHGEVHVVSRVVGFKKIKFYTNENVGSGELDLPEQQMHTTSYWLTIPADVMGVLPFASDDRRDGIVGLAFAMKQVAQLLLMCDGHDVGISIDTGDGLSPRDLHLRQLSWRHRLQHAAVPHARRAARRHAEADRRMPVRERLSGLCRADRQHRPAGEDGGAPHPRSPAREHGSQV